MASKFWISILAGSVGAIALAQQGNIAGPVSGFAFDTSARALRPIHGIPGAAVLGDAIDFGVAVTAAYVAPRSDAALAVTADGSLRAFRLNSSTATPVPLNGVTGSPERVIFSPSGTAAAVYAAGKVQTLTGFPGAPSIASSFEFTPGGGGQRGARRPFTSGFAVSDDGVLALIADGASIRLFQNGAERVVTTLPSSHVAFAPGTHDAVIAAATGRAVLIRNLDTTAAQQQLTIPTGATAAAFSSDSKTLYIASADAKTVAAVDLASGLSTPLTCDCRPTSLVPMGASFRLNELGGGPLWLLDAASSPARIVFVPARAQ